MKQVGRNLNKSEQFDLRKNDSEKEATHSLEFMLATLLAVIIYRSSKAHGTLAIEKSVLI